MPLFTIPFIPTKNLLHYYKAGDQASSVELLDDLRFIISCREYEKADFLFLGMI